MVYKPGVSGQCILGAQVSLGIEIADVVMLGNGASLAIDLVKLDEPRKDVGLVALQACDETARPLMASVRLLTPLPAIVRTGDGFAMERRLGVLVDQRSVSAGWSSVVVNLEIRPDGPLEEHENLARMSAPHQSDGAKSRYVQPLEVGALPSPGAGYSVHSIGKIIMETRKVRAIPPKLGENPPSP